MNRVGGHTRFSPCIQVCVDDFSDEPASEEIARRALESCAQADRITILKTSGRAALESMAEQRGNGVQKPFDFVFIDADKESQIFYFDFLLDKGLLAGNGVICVDNTLVCVGACARVDVGYDVAAVLCTPMHPEVGFCGESHGRLS